MSSDSIEMGKCPECGQVKSETGFTFDKGPRCPRCQSILIHVHEITRETRDETTPINSDTTADDHLDGDVR